MDSLTAKNLRFIAFLILWCSTVASVISQEKEDFSKEVALIGQKYEAFRQGEQRNVVFTGSSSIRLWEGLEELFPAHPIVNTGFGGSESSDLLKYLQPLVLDFRPVKVFIYEGDNDLGHRKSPARVLRNTRKILERIWAEFPDTEVVLIAAKPSPDRWNLKGKFLRLNRKLARFAAKSDQVEFANIWDVMLRDEQVDDNLFVDDGLHMNEKGYALWYKVLSIYLN